MNEERMFCACGQDVLEHSSLEELQACARRSGGELTEKDVVLLRTHPEYTEAQKQTMNTLCPCGKTVKEHSHEEIKACAEKARQQKSSHS